MSLAAAAVIRPTAEERLATRTRSLHKQTYWLAESGAEDAGERTAAGKERGNR